MKVTLNVDVEFQVTEEANRIGSSEKVVWARFSGIFSFPSLPRCGELIELWPLDDKSRAKLDVKDIHYTFAERSFVNDDGTRRVFNPIVFLEYVVTCGGGMSIDDEIVCAKDKIQNISDWLLQNGFYVSKPISYSFRC